MSEDILGCHNSARATGISWVEAREAVEHPVIHKTAPTVRNNLALTVHGAADEKRRLRSCNWRTYQSLRLISIFLLLETVQELYVQWCYCCLFYFYFLAPLLLVLHGDS